MVGVSTEAEKSAVLANRKSHVSEPLDNENGILFEEFQDSWSPQCASAIQIVRALESTVETQPQLQPASLRLSGINTAQREAVRKKLRSRWRVPVGLSALADRSTFMSARKKQTRRRDVKTWK